MTRLLSYAIAGIFLGYTYGHLVSGIELVLKAFLRILTLEV